MTDEEAEALKSEAQAFLEQCWAKQGLNDLGTPVARIARKYQGNCDPAVTHMALCEITIGGRQYSLAERIYESEWRDALAWLARHFGLRRPIVMNPETGQWEAGQSFREKARGYRTA
jgi:hypothetical protein